MIKLLKEGIEEANWKKVCDAYLSLTGEKLAVPSISDKALDYGYTLSCIRVMINDALGKTRSEPIVVEEPLPLVNEEEDVANDSVESESVPIPKPDINEKFRMKPKPVNNNDKKACKIIPFKAPDAPNKFKDNLKMCANAVKESKELSSKRGPHEKERDDFSNIELDCGGCGKTFEVHPSLRPVKIDPDGADRGVEPVWFCDRCVGKGKRNAD